MKTEHNETLQRTVRGTSVRQAGQLRELDLGTTRFSRHLLQNVCRHGNNRGFTNISWHKGQNRLTELPVENTGLSIIGLISKSSRTDAILCSWKYKQPYQFVAILAHRPGGRYSTVLMPTATKNSLSASGDKLREVLSRIKSCKVSFQ